MSSFFTVVYLFLLLSTSLSVEDEKRIYGGRYANAGEFPWMVFIKLTEELNCSGFLISPSYVLTAAHCMIKPLHNISARIGNTSFEFGEEYNFQSYSKYPDYNESTFYGDIALLKLSIPVTFSPDVNRICLPSNNTFYHHDTPVLQMGWGRFANNSIQVSKSLKVTDVGRIFGKSYCEQMFDEYNVTLLDGVICVKNSGNDGVCGGDSGGPLVVKKGTEYTAIGLDSGGYYSNCTVDNSYAEIFTDISYYQQWIMNQMEEDICEN